jgi:hypothetical protein
MPKTLIFETVRKNDHEWTSPFPPLAIAMGAEHGSRRQICWQAQLVVVSLPMVDDVSPYSVWLAELEEVEAPGDDGSVSEVFPMCFPRDCWKHFLLTGSVAWGWIWLGIVHYWNCGNQKDFWQQSSMLT